MEVVVLIIFILFILIPLGLGMWIPIYKKHFKVTGNIINYDSFMRKFVYKVYMSEEEILNMLRINNVADLLTCTVDLEKSTILFSEYGWSITYSIYIQECEGFSVLRLNQIPLIGMRSDVPYKLNPFIVKKLNAEIIPFSKYGL